jgi:hypothetical protein
MEKTMKRKNMHYFTLAMLLTASTGHLKAPGHVVEATHTETGAAHDMLSHTALTHNEVAAHEALIAETAANNGNNRIDAIKSVHATTGILLEQHAKEINFNATPEIAPNHEVDLMSFDTTPESTVTIKADTALSNSESNIADATNPEIEKIKAQISGYESTLSKPMDPTTENQSTYNSKIIEANHALPVLQKRLNLTISKELLNNKTASTAPGAPSESALLIQDNAGTRNTEATPTFLATENAPNLSAPIPTGRLVTTKAFKATPKLKVASEVTADEPSWVNPANDGKTVDTSSVANTAPENAVGNSQPSWVNDPTVTHNADGTAKRSGIENDLTTAQRLTAKTRDVLGKTGISNLGVLDSMAGTEKVKFEATTTKAEATAGVNAAFAENQKANLAPESALKPTTTGRSFSGKTSNVVNNLASKLTLGKVKLKNTTTEPVLDANGKQALDANGKPITVTRVETKNSKGDVTSVKTTAQDGSYTIENSNGTKQAISLKVDGKQLTIEVTDNTSSIPGFNNKTTKIVTIDPATGRPTTARITDSNGKEISNEKFADQDDSQPDILTSTKTYAKTLLTPERTSTIIRDSKTNLTTEIDPTAKTVTSTTEAGQKVTYRADGGYTIEGKNTVVDFSFDPATGKPITKSYAKGDWTSKTVQDESLSNIDQARKLSDRTLGRNKPEISYGEDSNSGSKIIETRINGELTSTVEIHKDGKITSTDGAGNTLSEVTTNPTTGNLEVAQEQDNGSKPVVRTVDKHGSIYKTQNLGNGAHLESFNNGPDFTVTPDATGKNTAIFTNSRGSKTALTQDKYTMTIISEDGKGLFGTGLGKSKGTTEVIDFSSSMNKLLSAKPEAREALIDEIALKSVSDTKVLSSLEYATFKDNILKELNEHTPDSPASWVEWLGQLFKRILSLDEVSLAKTSMQKSVAGKDATAITDAINRQESKVAIVGDPVINANGSADITTSSKIDSNKTTTQINTKSDAIINSLKNEAGTPTGQAAYQPDKGFVITSIQKDNITGKPTQIIIKDGKITNSNITNSRTSTNAGSAKTVISSPDANGNITTTTLAKNGKTPVSMSIRGLDGSVKIYNADSKGNLPDLTAIPTPQPNSEMKVNADGSVDVISRQPEAGRIPGRTTGNTITTTVKIDPKTGKMTQTNNTTNAAGGVLKTKTITISKDVAPTEVAKPAIARSDSQSSIASTDSNSSTGSSTTIDSMVEPIKPAVNTGQTAEQLFDFN